MTYDLSHFSYRAASWRFQTAAAGFAVGGEPVSLRASTNGRVDAGRVFPVRALDCGDGAGYVAGSCSSGGFG